MHTHSSHFNDQSYSDSDDMCANDVVFCTPTITASKWRKINHSHEKKTTTNSKSNNKLIKSRWFCAVAIVVLGERRMSEEEGVGQMFCGPYATAYRRWITSDYGEQL